MRSRNEGHHAVTNIELFFDLVFVFAITQLSHLLIGHLNPEGAFQTVILLVAVWLAWMYTAWMTNWFDPNQIPIRLILIGLMLISLIMSSAIPHAFSDRALLFAVSYVAIQVGRPLVILLMIGKDNPLSTTFQGIVSWAGSAGVLWILGSQADGAIRTGIWIVALLIELAAPFVGYRFPSLGRSTTTDWNVEGHHIAERCQLFLILAFGESILVTGATFGDLDLDVMTIVAFATAFVGSVALWWVYFHRGASLGAEAIASSADPGQLARSVYSYAFVLLIAGVVTTAVANELVIAHPVGHIDTPTILVLLGGTGLYLIGNALIVWMFDHRIAVSLLVAVVALGLLGLVASHVTPLALGVACAVIALATAAWEVIGFPERPLTGHKVMSET